MSWSLLIQDKPERPARNMATDAALLTLQRTRPRRILRCYAWQEPALTVGYFQDAAQELDLDGCQRASLPIVRRPTGGGVVFHDRSLTFSWIAPGPICSEWESADRAAAWIGRGTVLGLARLGATVRTDAGSSGLVEAVPRDWCLFRPVSHDAVYGSRKVAGWAQRRTRFGWLVQAYLLLDLPQEATLRAAGGEEALAAAKRGAVGLRAVLGRAVEPQEVWAALAEGFAELLGEPPEPLVLGPDEEATIERIEREVFGRPEWTFGPRAVRRRLRRRYELPTAAPGKDR